MEILGKFIICIAICLLKYSQGFMPSQNRNTLINKNKDVW